MTKTGWAGPGWYTVEGKRHHHFFTVDSGLAICKSLCGHVDTFSKYRHRSQRMCQHCIHKMRILTGLEVCA